jgi:cytidine deaminase
MEDPNPTDEIAHFNSFNRIVEFLRLRVLENDFNTPQRFAHAAALVMRRKVINWGFNSLKPVPSLYKKYSIFGCTMHAEISACWKYRFTNKLQGNNIFVIRVRTNGELALSKPCNMCQAYMRDVGIRRCYYTDNDGQIKYISF